jgi:hypothetical protein
MPLDSAIFRMLLCSRGFQWKSFGSLFKPQRAWVWGQLFTFNGGSFINASGNMGDKDTLSFCLHQPNAP